MSIPKRAKKVFEGVIYDVYQWEEKLYDGSIGIFEGLKRPDSTAVIAVKGDRIVLNYQEQPAMGRKICLFGGRVDEGETPEQAVKREFLEESGLVSDDWELFKEYENGSKREWNTHVFIARNVKKAQEPNLDPGEKIEPFEASFEEFLELLMRDDFRIKDFAFDICKMAHDPKKLEEFKNLLFK